jgi:hypothetical protein
MAKETTVSSFPNRSEITGAYVRFRRLLTRGRVTGALVDFPQKTREMEHPHRRRIQTDHSPNLTALTYPLFRVENSLLLARCSCCHIYLCY